jgi:type IV pilus assembly protein PilM
VITNCGCVNIPQDSPEYDPSYELRDCLSKHNVRAKKAVIAVPARSTEQITLDLKFLEENISRDISNKELRDRVWLKARDEISDLYDSVIDCQFLRRATFNGRPGSQILFVAVNREYIEERIALVRKIGLIPVAIDVDLFAIERLATYTGQLPSDSYVTIIDIGNSKASIGFYQNGILNHISDVDEGGKNITKEIANNLDVALNEAEAWGMATKRSKT